MLAGVGLLVVCCSSSSAMMMMGGGEEKEDPVVPKTPAKKSPEQIKADEAKAALAALKADRSALKEMKKNKLPTKEEFLIKFSNIISKSN